MLDSDTCRGYAEGMRQQDVKVGGIYLSTVNGVKGRRVKVLERAAYKSDHYHQRFVCEALDTGCVVRRCSAGLSPSPTDAPVHASPPDHGVVGMIGNVPVVDMPAMRR